MPNPIPSENKKKQKTTNSNNNNTIILHLPHHQNNPTKQELHHLIDIFKKDLNNNGLPIERIIIAHSKAPNIGDICKKHCLEGYIDTT